MRWKAMDCAPRDGRWLLLLTSDFGIVQARWDKTAANFYKSQVGWASYDPDNAQGEWVSDWQIGNEDERRMFCGATPKYWAEIGKLPKPEGSFDAWFEDLTDAA